MVTTMKSCTLWNSLMHMIQSVFQLKKPEFGRRTYYLTFCKRKWNIKASYRTMVGLHWRCWTLTMYRNNIQKSFVSNIPAIFGPLWPSIAQIPVHVNMITLYCLYFRSQWFHGRANVLLEVSGWILNSKRRRGEGGMGRPGRCIFRTTFSYPIEQLMTNQMSPNVPRIVWTYRQLN